MYALEDEGLDDAASILGREGPEAKCSATI